MDQPDFGVSVEQRDLFLQLFWEPHVVVIEDRDELAFGGGEGNVERPVGAEVVLVKDGFQVGLA